MRLLPSLEWPRYGVLLSLFVIRLEFESMLYYCAVMSATTKSAYSQEMTEKSFAFF